MNKPTRRGFLQSAAALTATSLLASRTFGAETSQPAKKIGYALVGLGRFNTNQILPNFVHSQFSRPVALVSGHADKANKIAEQYSIPKSSIYTYETYEKIKDNPEIDAVYIALPNAMHAEYTVRAANSGKHVFCEKPMANSVEECQQMIDACKKADRKLMIGYRLRYEPVTRKAIELVKERSLGKPRLIQNIFSFNIAPDQWRLDKKLAGGGPLVDIGVYCLNAARYLTGEEPTEITASLTQDKNDQRFKDVEDSVVFTLKFPSGCLAACSCSYANASGNRATAYLEKGTLEIDPAYGYSNITMKVKKRDGDTTFGPSQANQFASELDHFSRCILDNTQPLTPGEEGMKDVRYIRAIYEAAEKGTTIRL